MGAERDFEDDELTDRPSEGGAPFEQTAPAPESSSGIFRHLEEAYVQVAIALAHSTDALDGYTAAHSERLATLAEVLAHRLRLDVAQIEQVGLAALLHDVGKIGIPEDILRKPASLTEAEWALIRIHPVVGEALLAQIGPLRGVARIVRQHQERWDGSGYPDGLAGERIDLRARIIAVVDAYVAMRGTRPFRAARTHEEALEEMRRVAGKQLDPRVVEVFAEIFEHTLQ